MAHVAYALVQAFPGGSRNGKKWNLAPLAIFPKLFEPFAFAFDVQFGAHDGKGTRGECFIVGRQFMAHDFEARDRLLGGPLRNIDHMDDETGALDVPEKLKAETFPLVGAFNQSGNVCNDEAVFGG